MKDKFDEVRKKNSRQRTASEDEDELAKEKGDEVRAVRQRCFNLEIQNSALEKLVDELIDITADLEAQVNVLTLTSRKTDALEDKMKAVEVSMKEFAAKILKLEAEGVATENNISNEEPGSGMDWASAVAGTL